MILGIYGAGDLGREVFDLVQEINRVKKDWSNVLFISDIADQRFVRDIPVLPLGRVQGEYGTDQVEIVVAIGEPHMRKLIGEKVKAAGFRLATCIHPSTRLSPSAFIGEGVVIQSGCLISCDARIEEYVCIQPNVYIGHDCTVGSSSVLSAGTKLAGHCNVGKETFIGMSASVKEGVTIGNQVIVGMGATVLKNIPDRAVTAGNPARIIAENDTLRVFKTQLAEED